jgi:hypothetical protein
MQVAHRSHVINMLHGDALREQPNNITFVAAGRSAVPNKVITYSQRKQNMARIINRRRPLSRCAGDAGGPSFARHQYAARRRAA